MANQARPPEHTDDLCSVLRKYLRQGTNLGVAIPVLEGHVASLKKGEQFRGLTEKEIKRRFRELSSRYFNSDYHPAYLNKALTRYLVASAERYQFRQDLVRGVSVSTLEELSEELIESLRAAFEARRAIINELEQTKSRPVADQYELIEGYLKQFGGTRGEMFEVVSFAVLREYFRTFGFSLQRFSTTHANDGGMDFVGGEAIYQVSTDEGLQKLRRDLAKAPGIKRVLVRPNALPNPPGAPHETVLEVIELKDLLGHFVNWLMERDERSRQPAHAGRVLEAAIAEFRREMRAETGEPDLPN
ncbi:MAG TPA: hypothetical protein VFO39_04370 [Candidatus Sulfotelmatobacter sp.]|nr:hypothetical protein [Candidatus Sulfotelmatobacter sp.]